MPTAWDILLDLVLLAWVMQATVSALQARKLLRRLGREPREAYEAYRPPAVVVMPFKGIEPRLEAALDRLFVQDYGAGDYRLLLVVDSPADPAYRLLQQVMVRYPQRRAELMVAGEAGTHEGQKVHNQLAAIDALMRDRRDEVWVFADSDAVPGPQWLGEMVGPLAQHRNGVTTGYRWLVPENEPRASLWSRLASVINSSVACMLCSRDRYTHAWGGSMAMRADFAIEHDLRSRLTGALTDDYPVSKMCRDAGKRVYFVARCLVPTPVTFDRTTLSNFAYRQYLITRVYAPLLFGAALVLTWLYVLGLVAAATWLVTGRPWYVAVGALVLVSVFDQIRATYRAKVVRAAFDETTVAQLKPALQWDRWATPVWMLLHGVLVLRAAFGRTMTWRGMRYVLRGPNEVRRV